MPETLRADVGGRSTAHAKRGHGAGGLLCVANFPANTGYAWDFIETLYARVADQLAERCIETWVAYPEVDAPPRTLRQSAAVAVPLEIRLSSAWHLYRLMRFVRHRRVRALYFADRAAFHPAFAALRAAGVRRIVVHDHTSGSRSIPRGAKRWFKHASRRLFPFMLADVVIGVSDFVAQRKVAVDLVPAKRVRRIWNSLDLPTRSDTAGQRLRREFGLAEDAVVIACACRAAREKGVDHLMRAFDAVEVDGAERVVLLYLGDGPWLSHVQALRETLRTRDRIILGGFRSDAADLLGGADVCVVPSTWEEAFGLSALEPMSRGVPVIASRVGGLPEIVVDGTTGLLVPAGDEAALAAAMTRLLENPEQRKGMGEAGRRRAEEHFSMSGEVNQLVQLIKPAFQES